jgi:hypothetical protein
MKSRRLDLDVRHEIEAIRHLSRERAKLRVPGGAGQGRCGFSPVQADEEQDWLDGEKRPLSPL